MEQLSRSNLSKIKFDKFQNWHLQNKYPKINKIFSKNFNLQTFMTLALTELIFEPITLKRLSVPLRFISRTKIFRYSLKYSENQKIVEQGEDIKELFKEHLICFSAHTVNPRYMNTQTVISFLIILKKLLLFLIQGKLIA